MLSLLFLNVHKHKHIHVRVFPHPPFSLSLIGHTYIHIYIQWWSVLWCNTRPRHDFFRAHAVAMAIGCWHTNTIFGHCVAKHAHNIHTFIASSILYLLSVSKLPFAFKYASNVWMNWFTRTAYILMHVNGCMCTLYTVHVGYNIIMCHTCACVRACELYLFGQHQNPIAWSMQTLYFSVLSSCPFWITRNSQISKYSK